MPIHKEGSGEQWGNHGKVYHGPDAKEKAEKQAAAAHAHGFRGDSEQKEQCAGLLLWSHGKVLLLHRAGREVWEGPGGHQEPDESPWEAAVRETEEEIGAFFAGAKPWKKTITENDNIHYTTFWLVLGSTFECKLSDEHDEAEWFKWDELPANTHPGFIEALKTFQPHLFERKDSAEKKPETEQDVAKAIRDGKLPNGQRIGDMWLFDLRITGTGISYRPNREEYVYRPEEFYLNEDFLERCQGLPVIFDHPEEGLLDTEEFRQRSIGSIILPYIPTKEDKKHRLTDVWGIARIYDGDAAELLLTTEMSTSPAVSFGDDDLRSTRMEDGSNLLIEGNPSLLDHLAVVSEGQGGAGVWDKGTDATGVA